MLSHIDPDVFGRFVERHKPAVYRLAVALTGDSDDAEDVTQEVFVIVHRKLAGFRADGAIEGWLYRITCRAVQRQHGKTRRRAQLATLPAAQPERHVYLTDPGARVDRERALDLIREIATLLPLRQREVFVLCDLNGHTPSDAAAILGLNDVTVRTNLFKARAAIRRQILLTHPAYSEARS